jgi:hypothetical protein
LARAIREARLDVDLLPALFEGEQPPPSGPTFGESDWSDLKR